MGAVDSHRKIWGHKWGFKDTRFVVNKDGSVTLTGSRYSLSGYRMYDFLPYVESVLNVKLDHCDRKKEVNPKPIKPPHLNADFCRLIKENFKVNQYSFENYDRLFHSHGQTTSEEVYKVIYSELARTVDMVFFCESEEDAEKIVKLAQEHDVCLVPFGGGTSVSCALQLPENETRMIISVDMRRMNKVEWLDTKNLQACVQAGISGIELEDHLGKLGFTSGHEPDSIEFSTLGGWIATNASGMKKNRYGNIEQIVENITMITPRGRLEQTESMPRVSMGMRPQNLVFGCEGNLGLITKAVIKVHRKPEVKKYGSLIFPNFDLGTKFLYRLAQSGGIPASIRLVDNIQFKFGQALKPRVKGIKVLLGGIQKFYVLKVRGFDPSQIVAATIVMEGSKAEVAYQEKNIYALAKQFKGQKTGSENGRRGYMLTYAIAYIRDFLADFHIIGETFETTAPWSKIEVICGAVEARLKKLHQEFRLPGKPYISYRITQLYHTGVCIYFMFGVYMKGIQTPEETFARIEHSLRKSIIESGGSISHHHGVGKIRRDFMRDRFSVASIQLLKKVKQSHDPQNIFGIQNNIFTNDNE